MRVLIADDDPMQRLYLTRCLSSWGYETLVAEDGEEAWRILQADDAPPLVLLDWTERCSASIFVASRTGPTPTSFC